MALHVSSTCAHHQEVKIVLHSLWYHHTYRFDDTRGCLMQFWPPDDEQMCSNHEEAWNKLIVKQKFCASSWLKSEIQINPVYVAVEYDDNFWCIYPSNSIRVGTLLEVVHVVCASQPSFPLYVLKAQVLFQDIESKLYIKCIG